MPPPVNPSHWFLAAKNQIYFWGIDLKLKFDINTFTTQLNRSMSATILEYSMCQKNTILVALGKRFQNFQSMFMINCFFILAFFCIKYYLSVSAPCLPVWTCLINPPTLYCPPDQYCHPTHADL